MQNSFFSSNRLRIFTAALASLALACGGGGGQESAGAGTPTEVVEAAPPAALTAEMRAGATQDHLVPSPGEMQAALTGAGIETSLSTLVSGRELDMSATNRDKIAVRTGVVLADLLLTVKTATTEETVARFGQLREGLVTLQTGSDLPREIDDLVERISNGALMGDHLVFELDQLRAAVIPELEYEADWVLPMIQAGAWLEGANLVAQAIKEGEPGIGNDLLRQPDVVDYFLQYVQTEGDGRAADVVLMTLTATLESLKAICSKDTLEPSDIDTIQTSTQSVLELL